MTRTWTKLLCGLLLIAAPSVAQTTPAHQSLEAVPVATMPPTLAAKTDAKIEHSSDDLPFEIQVLPRPPKKRFRSVDDPEFSHRLTLRAKTPETCLSGSGATRVQGRDEIQVYAHYKVRGVMHTVRVERLLEGARPQLLVEDYYVDPDTAQAERVVRSSVPLLELTHYSNKVGVYAFREHHELNLVVSAPGSALIGPNMFARDLGCGLSRTSLVADGRGGVAISFALGVPDPSHPEQVSDFRAYGRVPLDRALRVSASISQTSRDPAPLISVTLGEPSPPVERVLRDRMPSWSQVLGDERARELQEQLEQVARR